MARRPDRTRRGSAPVARTPLSTWVVVVGVPFVLVLAGVVVWARDRRQYEAWESRQLERHSRDLDELRAMRERDERARR